MIKNFRKEYIQHFFKKNYIFGLLAIVILVAFLYKSDGNTNTNFKDVYAQYVGVAKEHEIAAYIPGIPENTVRERLNQILSEILVEEISASQRLSISKEGLDLIKISERQIDAIGDTGVLVGGAITKMKKNSSQINSFRLKEDAQEIIDLAQTRFDIISDIRGLSYKANHRTVEIFKRIISDNGKLTDTHVRNLNQQITEAEEQFDTRSRLYAELKKVNNQMEKKIRSF